MNWYKQSQSAKKPYKIYRAGNGEEREEVVLKDIYALSSEQARAIALQRSPALREYLEHCRRSNRGCDVVARLNVEKLTEIQEFQARKSKEREETIQEAWWQ
jgi:hypothetical protein